GNGYGRDSALERWSQHAGRSREPIPIPRHSCLYATQPRYRYAGDLPFPGIEGHPRNDRVRADIHAAERKRFGTQLLRWQFPACNASSLRETMARGERFETWSGAHAGDGVIQGAGL